MGDGDLIIDDHIVIEGSTNWTESAFDRSIEADVLIDSPELAKELAGYLGTIKTDPGVDAYLDSLGTSSPVSRDFMEGAVMAPLMVKNQDERAFDIYLYLLSKYDGNAEAKITLFYDDLAKCLGIYEGWATTDFRRQITKVLKKLEARYKLIRFHSRYAKEAEITLLKPDTANSFGLPDNYFVFGWNRILSMRAKFCYLVNLVNLSASDAKPCWSKSVPAICGQFGGVGQDIINKGMGELRREKLIDVTYDELNGVYEKRKPKVYKLLPLYDPKELGQKMMEVRDRFGQAAYDEARKYAAIVFEENNPEVIADIILKAQQYGAARMKRAFDIVAQKNIDNPKRSYAYVLGVVERLK